MELTIEITEVLESEKSILRHLIELYEYDFSEFNEADVNEHGYYGYKYFDHYWTDADRLPYFIRVNGKYAGFVLVNSYCYVATDRHAKSIAEFFVMRKYRRRGIGSMAARRIFDMFRGSWEVLQHSNNPDSIRFWSRVIDAYTQGRYALHDVTTERWQGQGFVFDNSQ